MPDISQQRIPFTQSADVRLRQLKGRTGITPNLLCRMGFCLSLNESGVPQLPDNLAGGREINRYTLLGKYDKHFTLLLLTRMNDDKIDFTQDNIDNMFIAHMNRGVELITTRVKTLSDLSSL